MHIMKLAACRTGPDLKWLVARGANPPSQYKRSLGAAMLHFRRVSRAGFAA